MKKGDIIFLSGSVPHREGWLEGARPVEIEEAVISLARAVFSRGGRLLFGGHPSISPLVSAVAGEYYQIDPGRQIRPVITFQSRLFEDELPDETSDMHRMGFSAIEWTPKKGEEGASRDQRKKDSLTEMRNWMLGECPALIKERNKLSPPRVMVAIGGMDGILEEAAIFLRATQEGRRPKKPAVYCVESGGGAARQVLEKSEGWANRFKPETERELKYVSLVNQGRKEGNVIGLEESWQKSYGEFKLINVPFQPYASMTQWLLDLLD